MKNKETYKILFIDPNRIRIDALARNLAGIPVLLAFQHGLDISYIVDTRVPVETRTSIEVRKETQ